jgi:hypothetical protein
MVTQKNLQTPTVKEKIRRYSSEYSACLSAHPNSLLVNLMAQLDNDIWLQRYLPSHLPTIFPVELSCL